MYQYIKLIDTVETRQQLLYERWYYSKDTFTSGMDLQEQKGAFAAIETQSIVNNYIVKLCSKPFDKLPLAY